MGDDRFGVAIREGNGPPRWRTFLLTQIPPPVHQRYDGATEWGAHRRGQLAKYRRSAISEVEEVANQRENDQRVERRAVKEAEASCTYCGRALDDSTGESGENHMRVPVTCPYSRLVHVHCILERAGRIARGHVDPRSCVTCRSDWAGGSRPPLQRSSGGACYRTANDQA